MLLKYLWKLNDIKCTFLLLYFGILSLSMTFPAKFIFSNLWHEKVNFGSYGKFQNQNENGVTLISSKSPDKRKHHRHEEESRMSTISTISTSSTACDDDYGDDDG